MSKHVLVTGGNAGIGLALCTLLARDHGCHVHMGARSLERGKAALAGVEAAYPAMRGKIEVIHLDVEDLQSCKAAAASLEAQQVKLYALVNNAGVGLAHGGGVEAIINTNYRGPQRVTEALLAVIDPNQGRVVNTSSGAASMWLREQDAGTKALFTNPQLTLPELDAAVEAQMKAENFLSWGKGYGLSKAALCALTLVQARENPKLQCVSLSPGFIDTAMTKGFGAKLSPEQGCLSAIKCLFEPVTSGFYYGSDGLRSPFTVTRDPGTPEYEGEADPDPKKYNK